jgi:hypothetical protein
MAVALAEQGGPTPRALMTKAAFRNALVVLQALHAGTFAACHLGAMAFIQRALPSSGTALGQSIYYALGTGATQAVIFQFAGVLYSNYGQHAFHSDLSLVDNRMAGQTPPRTTTFERTAGSTVHPSSPVLSHGLRAESRNGRISTFWFRSGSPKRIVVKHQTAKLP